jgi:hypothetical protein
MPAIGKYRIQNPTVALVLLAGRRVPTTVPAGAIIEVIDPTADPLDDRLVEVIWNGVTVLMFARDIRPRGIKID